MTDDKMADVFNMDQAEAAGRDQANWEAHISGAMADVAMKDAHTKRTNSQADALSALGNAITVATAAGTIWAIVQGVQAIIGWFQ